MLRGHGVHFGSPSTTAGETVATPRKIAHVLVVAVCEVVALHPEPPDAVAVTVTPAEGTNPFSVVLVPPDVFAAAPVTYTWLSAK